MEPTPDQLAHLALWLIARRAQAELDGELDEAVALRKALLVLVGLTQEPRNAAATCFAHYLLTSFAPLVSHLTGCDLDLWDGQTMGIRLGEHRDPVVSLPTKLVDSLMEEFLLQDVRTQREIMCDSGAFVDVTEAPWSITSERFIGFYDLMGFSALVEASSNDHNAIHSLMLKLRNAALLAEKMVSDGDASRQTVSTSGVGSGQLRVLQFSDAFLAITRDASPACELLAILASQMLFLHALNSGIVMRGAIARGRVTADFANSIFFGQPIVDAYRLEQSQCWYGVALHPTCQNTHHEDAGPPGSDEIPVIECYPVPIKGKKEPEEMLVINWPVFADSCDSLLQTLDQFDGRNSAEPLKLSEYHRYTREFAQAMWQRYRT